MRIEIRNLPEVQKVLSNLATEEIPYAMSVALNNTAYQVMQAERAEMRSVFDKPTPFIVRGMRYQKATKKNLTSRVYAGEITSKTVEAHIFGGDRYIKLFESSMRAAGLLPSGLFAVPGAGLQARLNSYGNIRKRDFDELLAMTNELGRTGRSGAYFVGGRGNAQRLKPGIYKRVGTGIIPWMMFVSKPTYQKRFAFYEKGQEKALEFIGIEIVKAAEKAVKRASS